MRILLDTNVIVAGLLSSRGPPTSLLRAWTSFRATAVAGAADFVVSGDHVGTPALVEVRGIPIVSVAEAVRRLGEPHQ